MKLESFHNCQVTFPRLRLLGGRALITIATGQNDVFTRDIVISRIELDELKQAIYEYEKFENQFFILPLLILTTKF